MDIYYILKILQFAYQLQTSTPNVVYIKRTWWPEKHLQLSVGCVC